MDNEISTEQINSFQNFYNKYITKYLRLASKILLWVIIIFFTSSVFITLVYKFINPPVSNLMVIRYFQAGKNQPERKIIKKWKKLKNISPNLIQAVVASEDNNFLNHFGIDFDAIKEASKYNRNHKRKHGASTITQQTAKNLFLWPKRSYIRKGFEVYFTLLIEICWSKKRIMEVYLNITEMGKGIYGAEAASNIYFNKPASKLTKGEAAMLAAILPNPRKRNPAKPSAYLIGRQTHILYLMDKIGKIEFN